jgi:hypothetical protein
MGHQIPTAIMAKAIASKQSAPVTMKTVSTGRPNPIAISPVIMNIASKQAKGLGPLKISLLYSPRSAAMAVVTISSVRRRYRIMLA